MKKHWKTIGILGGIGHVATAYFFSELLAHCQQTYQSVEDNEYPPCIVHSTPPNCFNATGITNEDVVLTDMIYAIKRLEQSKVDVIVMPCNTVHYFYEDLQAVVNVPIIHLINEVCYEVKVQKYNTVAVLCTNSSQNKKIYTNNLHDLGIQCIELHEEEIKVLTTIIQNVMGGNHTIIDAHIINKIIEKKKQAGAQAVVLGCTELPVVMHNFDAMLPIVSSTHVLAKAAVKAAVV